MTLRDAKVPEDLIAAPWPLRRAEGRTPPERRPGPGGIDTDRRGHDLSGTQPSHRLPRRWHRHPSRKPPALPESPPTKASFHVLCPHCNSPLEIAGHMAGQMHRCPRCDKVFAAPTLEASPPSATQSITSPAASGSLTLHRKKVFSGSAMSVSVEIDGKEMASLNNGATTTLPLPAGTHEITLRAWLNRSRTVQVTIQPGQVHHAVISPSWWGGFNLEVT